MPLPAHFLSKVTSRGKLGIWGAAYPQIHRTQRQVLSQIKTVILECMGLTPESWVEVKARLEGIVNRSLA